MGRTDSTCNDCLPKATDAPSGFNDFQTLAEAGELEGTLCASACTRLYSGLMCRGIGVARSVLLLILALPVSAAIGCSSDTAVTESCVEGRLMACTCDDGDSGSSLCENGRMTACNCSEAIGDSGSDGSMTTVGPADAGSDAAAADSPTAGGTGGMQADGGVAGVDSGGGTAASGGVGGDPGGTGGTGPVLGPTDPYYRCDGNSDCQQGLACYQPPVEGTGYCVASCGRNGGGAGFGGSGSDQCPQPLTGTTEVVCDNIVRSCVLGSCASSRCPAGMQCLTMMLLFPPTEVQACAYLP